MKPLLAKSHCILAVLIPTAIALPAALIVWLFSQSRRKALNLLTWLIGDLGRLFAGIKMEVNGEFRTKQAVIVFNHQSGVDPVILAKVLRSNVVAVANAKLKRHPIIGPLMSFGDTVFVEKNPASEGIQQKSVMRALEKINSGLSIVIAPEGTRTRQHVLEEFKSGAFVMAAKAGVPIVPIAIEGANKILPPDSLEMRPGKIKITILDEIIVEDTEEGIDHARQLAYQNIYKRLLPKMVA